VGQAVKLSGMESGISKENFETLLAAGSFLRITFDIIIECVKKPTLKYSPYSLTSDGMPRSRRARTDAI